MRVLVPDRPQYKLRSLFRFTFSIFSLAFCLVSRFVPLLLPPCRRHKRYIFPVRRATSSVQQLSLPLEHVCVSSTYVAAFVHGLLNNLFGVCVIQYFVLFRCWCVIIFWYRLFVSLCSRTCRTLTFHLIFSNFAVFVSLSLTVCDHNIGFRYVRISLGLGNRTDTGCADVVGVEMPV